MERMCKALKSLGIEDVEGIEKLESCEIVSTAEELAERMPFAQLRVVASLAEVDEIRASATHFLDELAAAGC